MRKGTEKSAERVETLMLRANEDGVVALPDGRQLYVNPDGWAEVAEPGQCTNTDNRRRVWTTKQGIIMLLNTCSDHRVASGGCRALSTKHTRMRMCKALESNPF